MSVPIQAGCDLVQLVGRVVRKGVDVGGEAGGGGCIDASRMVIYACLDIFLVNVSLVIPILSF